VVWYFGYWLTPVPEKAYQDVAELAVFCLIYGVYFVGVISVVNKYPSRRASVLTAAILTVVADTVVSCCAELPDLHLRETAVNIAYVAITVAYVAVWGIARRQGKSWVFGLPLAAVVSWAAQFGLYQHAGRSYWWEPMTAFVATFVVGCLICWALDVLGRRASTRDAQPIG
jgi:hypothetical protein